MDDLKKFSAQIIGALNGADTSAGVSDPVVNNFARSAFVSNLNDSAKGVGGEYEGSPHNPSEGHNLAVVVAGEGSGEMRGNQTEEGDGAAQCGGGTGEQGNRDDGDDTAESHAGSKGGGNIGTEAKRVE